jgi:hypothetical protein
MLILLIALAIATTTRVVLPARQDEPSKHQGVTAAADSTAIAHGRYLVHHVALCVECHSPRDDDGRLLSMKLLEGGFIPVAPVRPELIHRPWAFTPPRIAGLPAGYSRQELVTLLTEGTRPDGTLPRAPMPPFRMSESDARAVVAYLESLR